MPKHYWLEQKGQYFADPHVDVNAFFDQNYRIELPLIAGESYTLIVANGGNGQTFDYDITVISDNGTGVNGGGFLLLQVRLLILICSVVTLIWYM